MAVKVHTVVTSMEQDDNLVCAWDRESEIVNQTRVLSCNKWIRQEYGCVGWQYTRCPNTGDDLCEYYFRDEEKALLFKLRLE